MSNDEKARKARADRIHQMIDKLKSPDGGPAPAEEPAPIAKETPRDFIHRKMNETKKKNNGDASK